MLERVKTWRHVFKLDPDREISDERLEQICLSQTDAIIVGGSSGITYDNTVELLARIRRYSVTCALEISSMEAIVPGFDLFFIPLVLNTNDARWITGYHQQAIKDHGAKLSWHDLLATGYVVLNPYSTAAQITRAQTKLDHNDVIAYVRLAERLFQLPIVYIEYSGSFGDMQLVNEAAKQCERTRLFYGGGIDSLEKAQLAANAAHTIVVGNIIYEDIDRALETVLFEHKK